MQVVDTNDKEYKIIVFDEIIHQVVWFSDAPSSGNDQLELYEVDTIV